MAALALRMEKLEVIGNDLFAADEVMNCSESEGTNGVTFNQKVVVDEGSESDSSNQSNEDIDFALPLQQILVKMNGIICNRLDQFDMRLDSLSEMCDALQEKVEILTEKVEASNLTAAKEESCSPDKIKPYEEGTPVEEIIVQRFGKSGRDECTFLNDEADYPHGSWLGDENVPEMRVRCQISQTDLFLINELNTVPEKMALVLLDHLFDKQTLATSNLSGTGRHKKKQLDPLLICGIWCHLKHKFGISMEDWHRIKLNMDSKCRSAFRNNKRMEQRKTVKKDKKSSTVELRIDNVFSQSASNVCSLDNSLETKNSLVPSSKEMIANDEISLSAVDNHQLSHLQLVGFVEATPEQQNCEFHISVNDEPMVTEDDALTE